MNCKFCENKEVKTIKLIESPFVPFNYTLYKCKNCRCLFFDVNEHIVDIEKMYEDYSTDFNKNNLFKISYYWKNEVKIISSLSKNDISTVLDVGCRTGDFLLHFQSEIVREGVELSKNSVDIANERGLTVYRDFLENLEFNKTYDVVTAYALIEHLIDPFSFLNKLSQLVSQNGVLVIMIPYYDCLKTKLIDNFSNTRWHMYSPPQHLNLFSKQYLDTFLKKRGFKLKRRRFTSGGMFNPFKKIPVFGKIFGKLMFLVDYYSPINRIPVFDHMYSYYIKE